MKDKIFRTIIAFGLAFLAAGSAAMAQDNNDKCIEHGPYTNTTVSCGSLASSGQIGPTTFCVNFGDSVPVPSLITPPTFNDGSVTTTTTYDCAPGTTSSSDISYSPGGLVFNPPPPDGSTPGTFTSDCYLVATSSNTNCAAILVDYGNVTWTVTAGPTEFSLSYNPSELKEFVEAVGNEIESLGACPPPGAINAEFEFTETDTPQCCEDGSIKNKEEMEGALSIDSGTLSCDFPFLGVPYVASVNVNLNASISVEGSLSGEKGACEPDQDICGAITISGTFGGGVSGILGSRKILYVSGTIQGNVSGEVQECFNTGTKAWKYTGEGCVGPTQLVGTVKLFSGFSTSFKATIVPKFCTDF